MFPISFPMLERKNRMKQIEVAIYLLVVRFSPTIGASEINPAFQWVGTTQGKMSFPFFSTG